MFDEAANAFEEIEPEEKTPDRRSGRPGQPLHLRRSSLSRSYSCMTGARNTMSGLTLLVSHALQPRA
jgi:hypothetical protein